MRGLQSARRRDLSALSSERIHLAIARFQRARAYQALPNWLARGFCAGVLLDLVLLVAGGMRGFTSDRTWLLAPPVLLAALVALVTALRRAPSEQVAREVDARLGLAARVATALEIERRDLTGSLAAVQRADAVSHLGRFDPREAFPLRFSRREALSAVAALALLIASAFLPRFVPAEVRPPVSAEIARAEAERLNAMADELAADEDLTLQDQQALGQTLAEVAHQVQQQADSPERAMAALSETERALASQANANAADHELALARLADALDQPKAGQEAARFLDRRDYDGAARELQRLGEQAAQLSPDERLGLAEAMERAAANSSRLDASLGEQLAAAATALRDEQAAEALSRVAEEVQRAGQEVMSQQARERALAALQEARRSIGQGEQRADGGAGDRSGGESSASEASGSGGSDDVEGSRDAEGPGRSAANGDAGGESGSEAGGGGSEPGTGSLRNRGESEPNDFRSRQVHVPTGEFEQPRLAPGQQTVDGPDGEAVVDYRDVLTQYRERATEAMASRYVPPGMKDLVRDYFSSLDASK